MAFAFLEIFGCSAFFGSSACASGGSVEAFDVVVVVVGMGGGSGKRTLARLSSTHPASRQSESRAEIHLRRFTRKRPFFTANAKPESISMGYFEVRRQGAEPELLLLFRCS